MGHSEVLPNVIHSEAWTRKNASGALGNSTVFILDIIYDPLWARVCHTNEICCKKSLTELF